MMTEKTNAMRMLDAARIPYQVRSYTLSQEDFSAEQVAEALALPSERVFKTLVVQGDRSGTLIALVPAGTEIDLKRLAAAARDKRVELAPLLQVRSLTGYERGAVTPLAIPHPYPIFIDETADLWPQIGISGGAKGLEILLNPQDLIALTNAQLADIARSVEPG
jgi:Cys-tRNA(Pro)/Cys-tRNA(Cys) deacylase